MDGWNTGANKNAIPASARHRSTPAASRSIFTPSASRTSAEPQWLEAARFPCLATGAPAAAVTIAATVEMLNVPLRSPPVPDDVDRRRRRRAPVWRTPASCAARPSTSSAVSPLVRKRHQEAADLAGRGLARHDPAHRLRRLVGAQRLVRGQAQQRVRPEVGVAVRSWRANASRSRSRRGSLARYTVAFTPPVGHHAGVVQW